MIFMDPSGSIKKKRCKEVDFVFVYEVKNREIQGIALVGYELIKRGYTVGYVNTWHGLHHDDIRYRAKVAVVFEAYNTDVIGFALSFIEHCDNVFNMQWEQILSEGSLEGDSIYVMSGDASKVFHAAWGEKNKSHLVNRCHIPEEKVKVVGHVGLDFVRDDFQGFYMSRKKICEKYKLDPNKEIILFLSTFTLSTDAREEELNVVKQKTQKEIIEWLHRYVNEHNNTYVIYRPHPTEMLDKAFYKKLQKENVLIIKDYSVQQWITISDVILNWFSTSLGDVYAAGKKCIFLRPYPIPEWYEYFMFKDIPKVTSYDEMVESINEGKEKQNLPNINEYYCIDEERCTYLKICDELEKIYNSQPLYVYDNPTSKSIKEKSGIIEVRETYGYLKAFIHQVLALNNSFEEINLHFSMSRRFYASEREIIRIMNKIGALSD